MHVGGVLVFDGRIDRDAVAQRISGRLHLIPRYGMRLEDVLGGAGYPVWEEVPGLDTARHVRRAAVPRPPRDAGLCEPLGDSISERLARRAPRVRATDVR